MKMQEYKKLIRNLSSLNDRTTLELITPEYGFNITGLNGRRPIVTFDNRKLPHGVYCLSGELILIEEESKNFYQYETELQGFVGLGKIPLKFIKQFLPRYVQIAPLFPTQDCFAYIKYAKSVLGFRPTFGLLEIKMSNSKCVIVETQPACVLRNPAVSVKRLQTILIKKDELKIKMGLYPLFNSTQILEVEDMVIITTIEIDKENNMQLTEHNFRLIEEEEE
jgi:hypothetical protein